jgi:Keratinocyte-associated gene product
MPIVGEPEKTSAVQSVPVVVQEAQNGSNVETIAQRTMTNETVAVTKVETLTAEDAKTPKTMNVTEAQVKPISDVQPKAPINSTPATATVKKLETTKIDTEKASDDGNSDDALKNNEEINDDGGLNNQDVFDEALEGSDAPDFIAQDLDEDDDDMMLDDGKRDNNRNLEIKLPQEQEPTVDDVPHKKIERVNFEEDPDSNFFTYLCALMFMCVLLYILHQNRHKILALFLEGRRGNRRGRERTRSGSKAAYSKLDCNLEEAITSKKSLSGKSMDIIY